MKANQARLLLLLCLVGCETADGEAGATFSYRGENEIGSRTADLSVPEEAETEPEPAGESSETRAETDERPAGPGAPVELRSDRQMIEQLRGRLSRSTDGLVRERRPDGLETIRFGERFSHVTLLKRMPDGSLRRACLDNPRRAEAFLRAPPDRGAGGDRAAGEPR